MFCHLSADNCLKANGDGGCGGTQYLSLQNGAQLSGVENCFPLENCAGGEDEEEAFCATWDGVGASLDQQTNQVDGQCDHWIAPTQGGRDMYDNDEGCWSSCVQG